LFLSISWDIYTCWISNNATEMAEVAGLVASVIAINGAAVTAFKIARSLLDAAEAIKGARSQIQAFANDIQAYASVVKLARYSLERHTGHIASPVLKYMKKLKSWISLLINLIRSSGSLKTWRFQSQNSVIEINFGLILGGFFTRPMFKRWARKWIV